MEQFTDAVQAFVGFLRAVDQSIHGQRMIRWRLADLSYSSPATISCEGSAASRRIAEDPTPQLVVAALDAVEGMETSGRVLRTLSDTALEEIRALGELRGRGGITNVHIVGMNGVPDAPVRVVPVTPRVVAAVQDVLGGRYRAIGSVEGRLEGINIHGAPSQHYFNVYEPLHGRRVRVLFSPSQLEEARAALGQRVLVFGEVESNARGHPVLVKSRKPLRILRGKGELPTVEDIARITGSLTGGTESTQFIRELWDGGDQD